MSTYMLSLWPNKAENEIKRPMYISKIHDFSKKKIHLETKYYVLLCVFLENIYLS